MSKEIKYYPLNESQKMMFKQMTYCLRKCCVNICTEIEFQEEINVNILLQALYMSFLRTAATSMRVHRQPDKSVVQYFSDAAPEGIEYLDFSDYTDEQVEKIYEKWNATAFPNKLMDTQLYNIKLIKKPNGKHAIYGNYCHLIFDAYSVMAQFRDIMRVYVAIKDHTPLPPDVPSLLPAYEADFAYSGSEKEKEDKDFFDKVPYGTEPFYASLVEKNYKKTYVKGKNWGKYIYHPMMPGDSVDLTVSKEYDSKIVDFALKNGVSPQVVYLMGLTNYLRIVNEQNDIIIANSVARRATVAQKRAGGTMVNAVVIRTDYDVKTTSFIEGCKIFYETQCETYKHANFGMTQSIEMSCEKFNMPNGRGTYYACGTSYQPYFNFNSPIPVKFRRMCNGTETQALYLSIMPCDSEGTMAFNYSFSSAIHDRALMERIHNFTVPFLERAVENPDKTIAELAEGLL